MKRFLVFSGKHYYPEGGMLDFKQDFDLLTETVPLVNETIGEPWSWSHVWDSQTRRFVFAIRNGDMIDDAELAEMNGDAP